MTELGGGVAPSDPPWLGGEHCSEKGCEAVNAVSCAYVDRRQRACPTSWCPDHQSIVDGLPYCRRHAGVLRAVGTAPDRLRSLPDLENRAPSLVNWVAHDVDADVRALLQHYSSAGATVTDSPIQAAGHATSRIWSRHWKVLSHTGFDVRIALSVAENQDTLLLGYVEGTLVHTVEPPWIASRRRGAPVSDAEDSAARERFRKDLIAALEAHLAFRYPDIPPRT